MAVASVARQVLATGLSALTAAVVARALHPAGFGVYAGGTAAFFLAVALTDLGFAVVLARELAVRPGDEGRLVRATVHVQVLWSAAVALALVGLGLISGGRRGEVMLVLAPAVLLSGCSASRQIFTVRHRPGPLLALDILTALAQATAMIVLAATGAGPVAIAAGLGAVTCVNVIVAWLLALGAVDAGRPRPGDRRAILRLALPVGVASVLSSLYFTIDVVLLGWLVASRELGHYAAATRFLTALVALPALVIGAGIPGLARHAHERAALSRFVATLAHWLAATVLPLCVGLAVFAHPAVRLVFGSGYAESVGLLRILMLAGALCLVSNLLAIVLMSARVVRAMVVVNLFSLAVNVAGNLVLVPHDGVAASAWLTVVSELIVIAYGVLALRRRLSYRVVLARCWGALAACAAAALVAVVIGPDEALALPAALLVLAGALAALRAWPRELQLTRARA